MLFALLFWEVIALTITTLAFALFLSYLLFRSLAKAGAYHSPEGAPHAYDDTGLEKFADQMQTQKDWFISQPITKMEIVARDGVTLSGYFLSSEKARGTVLLLHGFHSEPQGDFAGAAAQFHERGFHVLLPIQRAHDGSGGRYVGFGILERYDLQAWTFALSRRFGPGHPILLYGVSMGASTVLMASSLPLPDSVCGLIADCGYTSPRDIFRSVMSRDFTLPQKPLLALVSRISRRLAGYSLDDYSTIEALQSNHRPVLFIHGRQDDLVPADMTIANFEACRAPKRLLIVDEARHAGSYFEQPQLYLHAVDSFLQECVGI